MPGSYSGDPATSDMDAVRCMLGDVGPDFLLTDEEIAYFDSVTTPVFGSPIMTAAVCADILSARFAGEVSISADGVSVSMEQLQQKYTTLAATLRQTYKVVSAAGGYPIVGGIDSFTVTDPSVRPFEFSLGMDDNPRAGLQARVGRDSFYYEQVESEPW